MGKTKEFQEQIDYMFNELRELHPYMSLTELNELISNASNYRNKAIIHQEDIESRKTIKEEDK